MNGEEYVKIIVEDDLNRISGENTVIQEPFYIRREYQIDDGAVIQYEWRAFPGDAADENFNHRFTLTELAKPNPSKHKVGVLKTIAHTSNIR